jgi:hypothetical protein
MLQKIIKRAKFIGASCQEPLNKIIQQNSSVISLEEFCNIDDFDVMMAIKNWCKHDDAVLSFLCNGIIHRKLLKIKYSNTPFSESDISTCKKRVMSKLTISEEDTNWLVYTGEATSSTYNIENEHIKILFKNGNVKDITEVDNALINENMRGTVKKHYICYPE